MPEQAGLTVSQLNTMVAEAIARDLRLRNVTVRGELSGFKHQIASGHWYFSLKDNLASISCVMFRSSAQRVSLRPRDGLNVVVHGYVDVYPAQGRVQLYVTSMREDGLGDLFVRFEELKRRLSEEGLFDPARKRPLPMLPRKVAVVTSESGAAIHDILNVSRLRSPWGPIVLVPVTVQGAGAGEEIAAGLRRAGRIPGVDVIIVGRGGGSPEDLWCFNEEAVARAVAASPVPVVSGVGHEIDVTICDFAADLRASTPSNAAELVFPDRRELQQRTGLLRQALVRAQEARLHRTALQLSQARTRLMALSPEQRLRDLGSRALQLRQLLSQVMAGALEARGSEVRLARIRLPAVMDRRWNRTLHTVAQARSRLEALSPLAVLDRGYLLAYSRDGALVKTAAQAQRQKELRLRFADGQLWVRKEHESEDGTNDEENRRECGTGAEGRD